MSSRCQEVAESSRCPVKRRTPCVPWNEPFRPHHWKTRIAEAGGFPRPPPRTRRHHPAWPLGRSAPLGPCLPRGNLLPSHRKAHLASSSGRARGLSPGGPPTWLRSRGRRLGTTWRRVLKHASKWCPSASLVILANSMALQERAPEPCSRRAPGTPPYATDGGPP